jgi:hypothetical protein
MFPWGASPQVKLLNVAECGHRTLLGRVLTRDAIQQPRLGGQPGYQQNYLSQGPPGHPKPVVVMSSSITPKRWWPLPSCRARTCMRIRAQACALGPSCARTHTCTLPRDASRKMHPRGTHAPQAPYFAVFFPLAAEALRARMKEGGNEIFIAHHVLCGCLRVCSSSVGTPTSTAISTPGTKPHSGTPQNARKDRDVTSAEFDAEARRVGEKQEGEK